MGKMLKLGLPNAVTRFLEGAKLNTQALDKEFVVAIMG